MRIDELIYVGLNGYVIALHRNTGEVVWDSPKLKTGLFSRLFNRDHSGPISLLLDGDRLIASTKGYIYCLDPLTGNVLWNNPLKGYGEGITHLVSVRGQSAQTMNRQAAAQAAAEAHASSVAMGAMGAGLGSASSTGIAAHHSGIHSS